MLIQPKTRQIFRSFGRKSQVGRHGLFELLAEHVPSRHGPLRGEVEVGHDWRRLLESLVRRLLRRGDARFARAIPRRDGLVVKLCLKRCQII